MGKDTRHIVVSRDALTKRLEVNYQDQDGLEDGASYT